MARRQLLTDEERQALLGIPPDADSLARLFTLSRLDRNLVAERRGNANRLGCAVQLALLRHPGTPLAYLDQPADALVTWMAGQLDIPAAVFAEYARRPQTMTDHARQLGPAYTNHGRFAVGDRGGRGGGPFYRPRPANRRGGYSGPCGLLASSCPARL